MTIYNEFMDKRLILDTESIRNYNEYPEVEMITSHFCGCPCCCNVAYFPIQKITFIGHWRKSLFIPLSVGIFYLITISSYFVDTHNSFPNTTTLILSYFFTVFFLICFLFSYYLVIFKGPGYAPYNWAETKKHYYSWEESMRNIAIYNDQVKQARSSSKRPKRSCFSRDARRFVLRADHFCRLAKSWIGVKNYRYFLLACFYCFLFSASLLMSRFWLYTAIYRYYTDKKGSDNSIYTNKTVQNKIELNKSNSIENFTVRNNENSKGNYKISKGNNENSKENYKISKGNNEKNNDRETEYDKNGYVKIKFEGWHVAGIISTLICCFFGFSTLYSFYRGLHNLARNVTIFERLTKKRRRKWNRGCIRNFEEVCGDKKYLVLWPFPFFFCIEPMESGFYDEIWDPVEPVGNVEQPNPKLQMMDTLF